MRIVVYLLASLLVASLSARAFGQGPGFRGGRGHGVGPDPSFSVDRDDFHFLLENHDAIRREVKVLPNGVQTVTESDKPAVATRIQKHVAAMYQRVEHKRPIRMRDPLFAEIFKHADKIRMEYVETPKGVHVTETSEDDYVAELIKAHAKAVSGFAKYGFAEAHKTHALPGRPESGNAPMHSHSEMLEMSFAEFDRVYIPALALTNQMQQEAAARALDRLSKSWDARFAQQFHEMFMDDAEWHRDTSRLAQCIALAQSELKAGKLLKAHEQLEPIRDLLMDARRRNQVEYPLDTLSQFHATMEAIVKPAMRLDADTIDDAQIKRIAVLSTQALQEWELVEDAEFNLAMFDKDEAEQKQFPGMLNAEHAAIVRLQQALSTKDSHSIITAARGLKPPFAKIYMFFGDFQIIPHANPGIGVVN